MLACQAVTWTDSLDGYCERVGPALLAEPLNFVSNLAFLGAWFAVGRLRRKRDVPRTPGLMIMQTLLFAIGTGSALFHSFANRATMLADVIPILALLVFYLGYFLSQIQRWTPVQTGLGILGFLVLSALAGAVPRAWVNGSNGYLGSWLTLGGLAWWCEPHRSRLRTAALVFTVSLVCRSLDDALCPYWPWGTHFVWHLCNAVVLYQLLAIAVEHTASTAPAPASGSAH